MPRRRQIVAPCALLVRAGMAVSRSSRKPERATRVAYCRELSDQEPCEIGFQQAVESRLCLANVAALKVKVFGNPTEYLLRHGLPSRSSTPDVPFSSLPVGDEPRWIGLIQLK